MNIFGLFFSFLIPGIVIGMLISTSASENTKKVKRNVQRAAVLRNQKPVLNNNKLFVYSMADDCKPQTRLKLIKGAESRKKLYICSVDGNKAA